MSLLDNKQTIWDLIKYSSAGTPVGKTPRGHFNKFLSTPWTCRQGVPIQKKSHLILNWIAAQCPALCWDCVCCFDT